MFSWGDKKKINKFSDNYEQLFSSSFIYFDNNKPTTSQIKSDPKNLVRYSALENFAYTTWLFKMMAANGGLSNENTKLLTNEILFKKTSEKLTALLQKRPDFTVDQNVDFTQNRQIIMFMIDGRMREYDLGFEYGKQFISDDDENQAQYFHEEVFIFRAYKNIYGSDYQKYFSLVHKNPLIDREHNSLFDHYGQFIGISFEMISWLS